MADAMGAAMGIADRVPHGHAVAVTHGRGRVLDMLLFTSEEHTPEDAIAAGLAMGQVYPLARRMLLISVLDDVDLQVPNELDVEMWWVTVERCDEVGLELWEWIQTSRDLLRSLSMTAEEVEAV
jgi:hypothetical protein